MPREIIFLRHGKAFHAAGMEDFSRPLKDSGKRKAQRVGVWLQQHGLIPDHVVASPAERAKVTAEKCCKAMGLGTAQVNLDASLYLADMSTILRVLRHVPASSSRVLLVGHNPGLEQTVHRLSGGSGFGNIAERMDVTSLAHFSLSQPWRLLEADACRRLTLLHAADLPKKFPFPSPGSPEQRDRPAYYYTQSAVIPYRMIDGELKILLIRSSKNKHWVIPKGIADPGISLEASAAKEAWEEAGIEGEVEAKPVGTYQTIKWGASCTVTVYPMRVVRELPEDQWEERHRGRRWVSPPEAASLLHQAELRTMALTLEQRLLERNA